MSWIAVSDGRRPLRAPTQTTCDPLLIVGTLQIEIPFAGIVEGQSTLFSYRSHLDWPCTISMTLSSDGALRFHHQQGLAQTDVALALPTPDIGDSARITLCWHAPERLGVISIENLRSGEQAQTMIERPLPWRREAVQALVGGGGNVLAGVTGIAVSDDIEATGLRGGFAAETLIDTLDGPKPAALLRPGDQVRTADAGFQPIRRIFPYTVPAVGKHRPLQLKAPFFGLTRDLTLAADHRLMVGGVDSEYLFGTASVLMEAHYLERIAAPRDRQRRATMNYLHLLLDSHVCLSTSGIWCESLYLGDLADNPRRCATSHVHNVPINELPRHSQVAGPLLKNYEAEVLISSLCA